MTAPVLLTNEMIVNRAPAAGAMSPIATASARYSFVPTLQAVDLLREVGWYPVKAEQGTARIPTRGTVQRHSIRFVRDSYDPEQKERVDLVLYNSHDLGSSFKLTASVWRQVCGNGLMVASDFANFTHRHVGFNPEDFMQSAVMIADSAAVIADKVHEIKEIQLQDEERLAYASAAHALVYDEPDKAPVTPRQLLLERRYDDMGNDLWTTFNIVQENVIKGGLRGRTAGAWPRRITTRPVQSLERNIKLNQALWLLTERMAELKQG